MKEGDQFEGMENELGNTKDIYSEEVDEELEQADEISESEEGFMKGYNEEVDPSKCANCGKIFESEEFVEKDVNETTYRFCSEKCANKFSLRE